MLSSLFDSSHQHRVFAVVRTLEGRRCLPAFRRESRNVSVSNIAEYFRCPMCPDVGVTLGVTLSLLR